MDSEFKDLNPIEEVIDKDQEDRIFRELALIEGLHEYLRAIMARDLRNHFTVPKEQQDLVRGGYYRVEWLAKRIKSREVDK